MEKTYGFNESQYARLTAMLRAWESGSFGPGDRSATPLRYHPENHVRYHNDSGEAIPPFACMRITGVNSAGNAPWRVKVSKPNTTFYNVYLVNGPVRCAVSDNSWGTYLYDSGHVLCDDTYTPTVGQEWGPTSGQWSLVRNRPGFLIDGGATGTGSAYRAVAKQRIVTELVGKPTGDMTKGTAGPATIWMPKAASSAPFATADYEDSGYDDIYALPLGSDLTTSLFCSLRFEGSGWLSACLEN